MSVIFCECSDDVHIGSVIVLRAYNFHDRCQWCLFSGSRSGTQLKADCQTILKGVSSMEALWEGNGMLEMDRKEILHNSMLIFFYLATNDYLLLDCMYGTATTGRTRTANSHHL